MMRNIDFAVAGLAAGLMLAAVPAFADCKASTSCCSAERKQQCAGQESLHPVVRLGAWPCNCAWGWTMV